MASYPTGVHTVGPGQFPYDDGTMIPFGPDMAQRLATRVALVAGAGVGYEAGYAALQTRVSNGDAFPGMLVYTADTDVIWKYTGSAWVPATGGQFGMHATTSGSAASGTAASMTATTALANHGTVVSASTSTVSAVVNGWYRATAQINWGTNATGKRQIAVYKNGAAMNPAIGSSTTVPSDGVCQQSATGVVQCNAGDYFNLVPLQNSGAAVTFSAQLTLELVSVS